MKCFWLVQLSFRLVQLRFNLSSWVFHSSSWVFGLSSCVLTCPVKILLRPVEFLTEISLSKNFMFFFHDETPLFWLSFSPKFGHFVLWEGHDPRSSAMEHRRRAIAATALRPSRFPSPAWGSAGPVRKKKWPTLNQKYQTILTINNSRIFLLPLKNINIKSTFNKCRERWWEGPTLPFFI